MTLEQSKGNYYSVIPATVRLDKRLNTQQKLMYGEITALSNVQGYCFAKNKYFADLYNCDERTISRWISKLAELGYVRVEITTISGRYNRKIYMQDLNNIKKEEATLDKNVVGAIDKNVEDTLDNFVYNNNINNNNINYNIYSNVKISSDEIQMLKNEYGEDKTNRAIRELHLYKKATGKNYQNDYSAICLWVMDKISKQDKYSKKNELRKKNNNIYLTKGLHKLEYTDEEWEQFYDIG